MAPHFNTVARKIPWMEEPGRLQSMGSLRVRHDWATSLSLSTFMHWRRKWQPTPVFLPGESHGWRSLVGCSPWGRTESDTTEATKQQQQQQQPSVCSHFLSSLGDRKNAGYWLQLAEIHMKVMISLSLDSCVFPYTEKAKFLNLRYLIFLN